MEQYMLQALAARELELHAIAESYMNDPAFAQCRADEALWGATVGDGLENL